MTKTTGSSPRYYNPSPVEKRQSQRRAIVLALSSVKVKFKTIESILQQMEDDEIEQEFLSFHSVNSQ